MSQPRKPLRTAVSSPPLSGGVVVKTRRGAGVRDGLRFWVLRLYTYRDGRSPTVHLQNAEGFLNVEPVSAPTDEAIDHYLLSWNDEFVWSFVEEGILSPQHITWDLRTELQIFCTERPLRATAKQVGVLLRFDEIPIKPFVLSEWLASEDTASFARWMQERLVEGLLQKL